MQPGVDPGPREQIMAATVACVTRSGVQGVSLAEVAAEADVSRTTVYRYFPGGRPQLLEETTTWELARFWGRLGEVVEAESSLEDRLVTGLVVGRTVMDRSPILSNLMEADVAELLAAVRGSEPLIQSVIRGYLRDALLAELAAGTLRDGVDVDLASDYLTRMVLSWLGSPAGTDLTDPAATRAVVRRELLAGISATPGC